MELRGKKLELRLLDIAAKQVFFFFLYTMIGLYYCFTFLFSCMYFFPVLVDNFLGLVRFEQIMRVCERVSGYTFPRVTVKL